MTHTKRIADQEVNFHNFNTVIVGAGAAGMNCAVHLCRLMKQKGCADAAARIAMVTASLAGGASRMSGSDKQTYYKMGTSSDRADRAVDFAQSLTAGGCCHHDLALAEAIGSLREFYHLVEAGVPFPHDSLGGYVGYKTDNDPYERATSAGPKTSKFMSECLQRQVRRLGIAIYDHQEVLELLTVGGAQSKRIVGVVTINRKKLTRNSYGLNVYYGRNLVLAAGGPGELYQMSVYPKGQLGIHGPAFKAGLAAENLCESQFGLASIKFRWNVSGSYMQALPRIFSRDAQGRDEREFLADFFPTMSRMATSIFLKGYQWPFDPQRLENFQSSLIDVLVFTETEKGRRVFMDFTKNPLGHEKMKEFDLNDLEPEAWEYLQKTGAIQRLPIERLQQMNPPAIDIYREHGIDLHSEPLEIAVCAQHNNGGFAVDKWWQSNIPGAFVIGEMAGTHGVRRPGGAALNAGQVGGLRAAEFMVNVSGVEIPQPHQNDAVEPQIIKLIEKIDCMRKAKNSVSPGAALAQIQERMTRAAGHIRELKEAQKALREALELYRTIEKKYLPIKDTKDIITALQAENLALCSVGYLKAIVELLRAGAGSRGSHLVLAAEGLEIHPKILNPKTGKVLRLKPENTSLRDSILRIRYDETAPDLFRAQTVALRTAPIESQAFESAWRDFREGSIYRG